MNVWALLLNFAATWYMVGLIWMVQLVHYPLFAQVGEEGFVEYEQLHTRWTTWAVAPGMLVELATSVWLVYQRPAAVSAVWPWVGMGLVLATWTATAVWSAPCHQVLVLGFDLEVHRRLTASNWVRTFAWSAHGMVVGWMVLRCMTVGVKGDG